jgi:hypothetical protein
VCSSSAHDQLLPSTHTQPSTKARFTIVERRISERERLLPSVVPTIVDHVRSTRSAHSIALQAAVSCDTARLSGTAWKRFEVRLCMRFLLKDSSLPVGSFLWHIENLNDEPVEVSLMWTWQAGSGLSLLRCLRAASQA